MPLPRPALLALATLCLTACATQPATKPESRKDPRDPWERMNRSIYGFNDALDRHIALPVVRTYERITPKPVRTGVSNFFGNLSYPTVIVNDLLQGKLVATAKDTGRFVMNSTLGLAGFLDPATPSGLERNDEDFGQTFGRWGAGPGPYLVLPVLGPSSVRDGIGRGIAWFATDPKDYIDSPGWKWGLTGASLLNDRYELLQAQGVLEKAFDPYVLVRSAYLQRREYQVHDGDVPEEPADEGMELDDEPDAAPAPKP